MKTACEAFQNMCLNQSCLVWQSFKCQDTVLNAKPNSESKELKGSWIGLNLDNVQHFFVSRWQSTYPTLLSRFFKWFLGSFPWKAFWLSTRFWMADSHTFLNHVYLSLCNLTHKRNNSMFKFYKWKTYQNNSFNQRYWCLHCNRTQGDAHW